MSKCPKDVCPGCSRHCCADNVHCKYGRRYFEQKQLTAFSAEPATSSVSHHYKWEKLVARGGLAWKLLLIGSRSKKALRSRQLTEQALLSALTDAEQAQLSALLEKLSCTLG